PYRGHPLKEAPLHPQELPGTESHLREKTGKTFAMAEASTSATRKSCLTGTLRTCLSGMDTHSRLSTPQSHTLPSGGAVGCSLGKASSRSWKCKMRHGKNNGYNFVYHLIF
ncbi:hypothetical protein PGIGA_G00100300, partial [Pangasianodon gigas]|nr:hypothetical protein [Pangasianodon gigas]